MHENDQSALIEIYKLHSRLADQVSNRREGANRIFVTLLVGLFSLMTVAIRFSPNGAIEWWLYAIVGAFGILLSLSWWTVIRSYKQLNREKFRVLHELEDSLPFQFFKKEWNSGPAESKHNRYTRLTAVESLLPILFGMFFVGILVYGLIDAC